MQAHTVERVESWDSRPFSDGVRDLRDLADDDFSGAAVADGAWLFMLNGRVVGVYEGDIEDFEDASGTVYDSPHPSLPLLFSMRERGGETQAKYYTNDTPISEVDETLTDGNFTGYVELSENVLSGDYYVVYYGGRSMSAAFIGASEELVAGDDAFERANDEVGVYEVRKTPVNVTKLPEVAPAEDGEGDAAGAAGGASGTGPEESASGGSTGGEPAAGGGAVTDTDAATGDSTATTGATSGAVESSASERPDTGGRDPKPDTAPEGTSGRNAGGDGSAPEPVSGSNPAGASSPASASDSASASSAADSNGAPSGTDDASARSGRSPPRNGDAGGETGGSAPSATESGDTGASTEGVFDDEKQWRNARSVPTLDPKQSEDGDDGGARTDGRSQSTQRQSAASSSNRGRSGQSGGDRGSTVEKLKRAVQQRNEKLEAAGERIDSLEGEREELQARVEELRDERDELQARVEELEAERDADGSGGRGGASSETELEPGAALADTNLFVRYDSKGKATLDELDGETDADAVNQNLRIDHHTKFDASDVVVDGESFESFLTASNAHRFVSWAVRELPYEIRDAGHASGLADLYEALPRVDRAELGGTVEGELDGETVSRSFDVVLRDRMGEALVVAELNDERDAVTGDEMDALVDAATDVRECADDLSAAMYVTASFFEPRALETASDATDGGGLLSRSDRESYVKVARKEGYHLCLVEDRNDAFHLTVPEL